MSNTTDEKLGNLLKQKNAQINAMKKYISQTLQNDKASIINQFRSYKIAVFDGHDLTIKSIVGKNIKQAICIYISQYWSDIRAEPFYALAGSKKMDKETTMFLIETDAEISEEQIIKLFEEEFEGQFCIFKEIV